MKTVISHKFLAATFGVVAATLVSASAYAASVTGNASAVVATPIAISEVTAMSYGNIAGSGAVGTAVLDTADGLTVTGGVTALSGSTPASGAFSVTGQGTSTYSITLPTSVTLTGPGAATMTITGLGHSAGATPALAAGAASFKIGGSLAVGINQAAGTYASGAFPVTVNYQ